KEPLPLVTVRHQRSPWPASCCCGDQLPICNDSYQKRNGNVPIARSNPSFTRDSAITRRGRMAAVESFCFSHAGRAIRRLWEEESSCLRPRDPERPQLATHG